MPHSSSIVGFIYLVTSLVDGKVYVGLTKLIKKRWGEHLSAARKGSQYPLHRAIRKHGVQNFVVTCIETVTTNREDLLAAEIKHIAAYGCTAPKGYNLTSGGEGVDFSVPGVRERQIEGCRKRSANPEWQKHNKEGALKRAADPVCQENLKEGCRKRSADPVYQANLLEANRKRTLKPEWHDSMLAGAQKRIADLAWHQAMQEGCVERSARPEYREKNLVALPKAWAVHSAHAVARYAHLPIEEQEKRARRRELGRVNAKRRYDLKKAAAQVQQEL